MDMEMKIFLRGFQRRDAHGIRGLASSRFSMIFQFLRGTLKVLCVYQYSIKCAIKDSTSLERSSLALLQTALR